MPPEPRQPHQPSARSFIAASAVLLLTCTLVATAFLYVGNRDLKRQMAKMRSELEAAETRLMSDIQESNQARVLAVSKLRNEMEAVVKGAEEFAHIVDQMMEFSEPVIRVDLESLTVEDAER